ncbi:S41 family peptidase [Tenacibaculum sp. 190524A02b]|uniref:S41 family peptidase n=1 Tax=Tenacibaculum vairaonense TaxID=3137860 RepID=UPI0031FACB7B
MKIFRVSFLIMFCLILVSCSEREPEPENIEVQDFIWKGLNAYYFYQDNISDLSDRRFTSDQQLYSYLGGFNEPQNLFNSLLNGGDETSALIEDYTTLINTPLRNTRTYGIEFGIIAQPANAENVIGYVIHVLPNSNATTKNITRGEFFNVVDGTQLTRSNYEALLVSNENPITLEMTDFNGGAVLPNGKTVTLEKQDYEFPAIFKSNVIASGANNIGYLAYNNDFSAKYITELNNTFLNFKNQGVNQLVIDLRYNVSSESLSENLALLASMITGQFTNEPFIKEQWNTKAQDWFETHQPESIITNFVNQIDKDTPINSLNLEDVYFILDGQNFMGSPTTELLINSLKPYINVHVIGRETAGNNLGATLLYDSIDYDFENRNNRHTFALRPLVLKFLNKDNQSFDNGITPNIELCPNEDILNLGVLGEVSDPILNLTINYINSGSVGTPPNCNLNTFDFLYNSIDSQRTDSYQTVTIERDLPNTN